MKECVCLNCSTPFKTKPSKVGKFCSRRCAGIYQLNDGVCTGETVDGQGYVQVYQPDHHESASSGLVYKHRLVAEKKIGRPLKPGEVVHHKNSKRQDNRARNIEVLDGHSKHATLHASLRRQEAALGE